MKNLTEFIFEASGNAFNQDIKTFDEFKQLFDTDLVFKQYVSKNLSCDVINGELKADGLIGGLYDIHSKNYPNKLVPFVTTTGHDKLKIRRWIKDSYLNYFKDFGCAYDVSGIKFPGGVKVVFGDGNGKAGANTSGQELVSADILTKLVTTGKKLTEDEIKIICDKHGFDDVKTWLSTFNNQQDTFLQLIDMTGLNNVSDKSKYIVKRYGDKGDGNDVVTNLIMLYAKVIKRKKDNVQPADIVLYNTDIISEIQAKMVEFQKIKMDEVKIQSIKSYFVDLYNRNQLIGISMKKMDKDYSKLKVRGLGEKVISNVVIQNIEFNYKGLIGLSQMDFEQDIIKNKKNSLLSTMISKYMGENVFSNIKSHLLITQGDGNTYEALLNFRNKLAGDFPSPTMDLLRKSAGAIDGSVDSRIVSNLCQKEGYPLFKLKYKRGVPLLNASEINTLKNNIKTINSSRVLNWFQIEHIDPNDFEQAMNVVLQKDMDNPLEVVHRFLIQYINGIQFLCMLDSLSKKITHINAIYNTLVSSCIGDTEDHLVHIIIS